MTGSVPRSGATRTVNDTLRQRLRLALPFCRQIGIEKVLITCDKENTGSAKTILANGGVLENEVPEENRVTQRYWIML